MRMLQDANSDSIVKLFLLNYKEMSTERMRVGEWLIWEWRQDTFLPVYSKSEWGQ